MFKRIFTCALFAGACAGLIAGLLQLFFMQPVLLHAELYETGQLVHFGGEPIPASQDVGGIDPVRDGLSIMFNIAVYIGYALILVAAMAFAEERGHSITPRQGIIWGIAGFIAVQLAPGFTLAPEVPGVAAADIYDRQIWWFATVAAAVVALWLISFAKKPLYWGIAAALLLLPHIIGAPEPEFFAGPVPTELGALFAARSIGVGFTAWALTGLFAGYFWQQDENSVA